MPYVRIRIMPLRLPVDALANLSHNGGRYRFHVENQLESKKALTNKIVTVGKIRLVPGSSGRFSRKNAERYGVGVFFFLFFVRI